MLPPKRPENRCPSQMSPGDASYPTTLGSTRSGCSIIVGSISLSAAKPHIFRSHLLYASSYPEKGAFRLFHGKKSRKTLPLHVP